MTVVYGGGGQNVLLLLNGGRGGGQKIYAISVTWGGGSKNPEKCHIKCGWSLA